MAEQKIQTGLGNEDSAFTLVSALRIILKKKKSIIVVTAVVSITAIIISLLLPETFKSNSIILPETDKSKLAGFAGLSDLASLAGVGPGDTSPIKLYPAILKSETVLKNVILRKYKTQKYSDSVDLIRFWDVNAKTPQLSYELTLQSLREGMDVSIEMKTNIITINYETEEPQLTADIINAVTAELDNYMRTKRTTNATKQRRWIEARLMEIKNDLADAENRVKFFREKNRIVIGSPQLMLEQDRLMREVQINSTLYIEMKKQYELIKIEEIKNTPIVNVMDAASPAAKKNKPKRSIIVLTSFFLAFIGSCAYVLVMHYSGTKIKEFAVSLRR